MGDGAVVLDASALMAALRSEPGGERVAPLLDGGHLSAVNLSEVQAKLVEQGLPPEELAEVTAGLGFVVHAFDEDMARRAAVLRPATRARGLSLGDRACLALAATLGLPAATADRAWAGMEVGVEIRVVR
jgi:PIN domain nuclease of toxin-antitoxin system